jgi:hypothetical protein
MTAMALTSYSDVQAYLDNLIATLGSNIGGAPHGPFWRNLTCTQFTTGPVPGVSGYAPGDPPNPAGTWQILVIGHPESSNIIKALSGDPPFDGSIFPQMPADGPPYADAAQIQPLSDWIKAKCPNG